jgi:hypothetical protein
MMKTINRRGFLRLAGAAGVFVAAGGVWRAANQGVFSAGTGPAYAPWPEWRDAPTAPERVVAAGILASNPHNSQPWLFRVAATQIDLFADHSRQIGTIDPFLREMHIGLGCALENMLLAAAAEGYSADLSLLPDATDTRHVARISLTKASPEKSQLYTSIPTRHTDRGAYALDRSLSDETRASITQLVTSDEVRLFWLTSTAQKSAFGEAAVDAAAALIADEQQSQDSHKWWRQRWSDVQQYADGLTLDAQALGPAITTAAKLLPDSARQENDRIFVDTLRNTVVPNSAAFGILAIKDRGNLAQHLVCGRDWQRIHLWISTQELAVQPLNQMCERADRERQLGLQPVFGDRVAALIGDAGWHGIMPFRIGYALKAATSSPRRTLASVIR